MPEFSLNNWMFWRIAVLSTTRVFSRHLDWRFGDRKFDLLFVTDNAALKYAARNYQERFRGMPVVFSDVNGLDRIEFPTDMPVTGVSEHRDFRSTLELAASLRPNAKEIVVFGLSADNGSGRRKIQRYLSELNYRIPIRLHLDKSLEEIIDIASRIDPANIVFSMARAVDANGVVQGYETGFALYFGSVPGTALQFLGRSGKLQIYGRRQGQPARDARPNARGSSPFASLTEKAPTICRSRSRPRPMCSITR